MCGYMIGNLPYVKSLILYVIQSIRQITIFQEAPMESHLLAPKRIFKYLKGTTEFGIWYPKVNKMTPIAHTNAYLEGSIYDIRSTSGAYFYLGDCLVSWFNKK